MTKKEADKILADFLSKLENDYNEELLSEAIDKQTPKRPLPYEYQGNRLTACYICPRCHKGFTGTGIVKYCYRCGQAIDWS